MPKPREVIVIPADSVAVNRTRLDKPSRPGKSSAAPSASIDLAAPKHKHKHHHHKHHHHKHHPHKHHHHKHKSNRHLPAAAGAAADVLSAVELESTEQRYVKLLEEEANKAAREEQERRRERKREARRREFEEDGGGEKGDDDEADAVAVEKKAGGKDRKQHWRRTDEKVNKGARDDARRRRSSRERIVDELGWREKDNRRERRQGSSSESSSTWERERRGGGKERRRESRERSQSWTRGADAAGVRPPLRPEFLEWWGVGDVQPEVLVRGPAGVPMGMYPDGTFVPSGRGGGLSELRPGLRGMSESEGVYGGGGRDSKMEGGTGEGMGPFVGAAAAAAGLGYAAGLGRGSEFDDELDSADRYAMWVKEQARRARDQGRRHHGQRRRHRRSRRHRRRKSDKVSTLESRHGKGGESLETTEGLSGATDRVQDGGGERTEEIGTGSASTKVSGDGDQDTSEAGQGKSKESTKDEGGITRLMGGFSKRGVLKKVAMGLGAVILGYGARKVYKNHQENKQTKEETQGEVGTYDSGDLDGTEPEEESDVFHESRFHPSIPKPHFISVKVPAKQVAIVEKGGQYHRKLKAGHNRIIPCLEQIADCHSLKEMVMPIPYQSCCTTDNVPVEANGVVVFRVEDPVAASYDVDNPYRSLVMLAQRCIRNEIGSLPLQKVIHNRIPLSNRILERMEEITRSWGVRCIRFELRDVQMPEDLRGTMDREAEAERIKRAHILQSEAEQEAAINRAEGQRQAQLKLSQARQMEKVNEAIAEAHAITERSGAIAQAMRNVAEAVNEPGGERAMQMRIAEQYIRAYGNAARAEVVPPPDPNSVAVSMSNAIGLLNTLGDNPPAVPLASLPENPFEGPATAPSVVAPPIYPDPSRPIVSVPSSTGPQSPGRLQGSVGHTVPPRQPYPPQTHQSGYTHPPPPMPYNPPPPPYGHDWPSEPQHAPPRPAFYPQAAPDRPADGNATSTGRPQKHMSASHTSSPPTTSGGLGHVLKSALHRW